MDLLGNVYLDQGRQDLALEQFQKASQIAPDNQKAKASLARGLFAGQENPGEAETVLKGVLQSPATDLGLARSRALLWLANVRSGKPDRRATTPGTGRNTATTGFPNSIGCGECFYQRQGLLPQALARIRKRIRDHGRRTGAAAGGLRWRG